MSEIDSIVSFFEEHKLKILIFIGGIFIYVLYLIITKAPRGEGLLGP